jgi:hypothetical protein
LAGVGFAKQPGWFFRLIIYMTVAGNYRFSLNDGFAIGDVQAGLAR